MSCSQVFICLYVVQMNFCFAFQKRKKIETSRKQQSWLVLHVGGVVIVAVHFFDFFSGFIPFGTNLAISALQLGSGNCFNAFQKAYMIRFHKNLIPILDSQSKCHFGQVLQEKYGKMEKIRKKTFSGLLHNMLLYEHGGID